MTSRRQRGCRPQVGRETGVNTSGRPGRRAMVVGQDAEGTHQECENGAGVTLLKVDDGRHQPRWAVGGVQVNRRSEMPSIGRVFDDVFAAGVARGAQKASGPTYQFIRLH
eukprot:2948541-Pleurochrysis_carterae.AAC.2